MRSTKFSLSTKSSTGWSAAVQLTEAYLRSQQKADQLLDALPSDFTGDRRSSCQSLFLGGLRNGHRTRFALQKLMRKRAKATVEAILMITGFELFDAESERHPKIIHNAVEQSKRLVNRFEQGFLNAVLRKLPETLANIEATKNLAAYHSHPSWLLSRWEKEFPNEYIRLLEWNQSTPKTYLKIYEDGKKLPNGLISTNWEQFYKIGPDTSWKNDILPLLNKGNAYIKDPSTRLAPDLLAPKAGESVLDLCAAPGGKAYDLAHSMEKTGTLVAVDLPGTRIGRLRQNLDSLGSDQLKCLVVESDVLELNKETLNSSSAPEQYDAIMLDAPCSNTGVIQRRTDVKWRLVSNDIEDCAKLQLQLLHSASRFVKEGGRLVYSTCSIEVTENQAVVDAFLSSKSGQCFELIKKSISYPWETKHDGAGAFLLKKIAATVSDRR